MAVIGCDIPVRQVVGADRLVQAKAGLWTKTHFYQEGDFLHAKTFLVVAGNPQVLEFRIDLRPLEKVAARIHQRLHERAAAAAGIRNKGYGVRSGSGSGSELTPYSLLPTPGGSAAVGFSFSKAFKSIKSAAKSIGKSKLVKAVGGAIKSVAKSKLVGVLATGLAVAVPFVGLPALAAYGTAKAAIGAVSKGKKLVATAGQAQRTISAASNVTQKISTAKRQAPAQVQAVQAQARARASALAAQALSKASSQSSVAASNAVKAAATAKAKATLAQGKAQATAAAKNIVSQVKAAETKIAPVVAAARTLQQKLADPAVRAKLTTIKKQADSAKRVLTDIQQTAAHGTGAAKLDAQKSAAIVNLVAKNEARIQAMSQANAGGLPSLLIDGKGRIVPGKFRIVAAGGGKNPDVLYRGPKTTTERGAFAKVSGVPGIGASHVNWWTLEIKPAKSPRWVSLQPNGILFNEHWRAAKAVDWYAQRGVPAKATLVKYTPTPSELKKNQNRIGASPFPPPSPSEKRAKDAAYAAWLKQHAVRGDVEVSGQNWKSDGRPPRPGDLVMFAHEGKFLHGRATHRPRPGHWTVRATPKSGGRIHTLVPEQNIVAHDATDRAKREKWNVGSDVEVSGQNWKSDGRPPRPGDMVLFAHEGKFLHGRATQLSRPGHWTVRATPKSGGRIHTLVPERNIIAHDATDRAKREKWNVGGNTPFVGYAPSPAWATTIGCPCSDQGTQF